MPLLPRSVLLIARREYFEKIRGRAFRFSTVLVPLLMVLMMGASYFTTRGLSGRKRIAIASASPGLAAAVRGELLADKTTKLDVEAVAPVTGADREELEREVKHKTIGGFLYIAPGANDGLTATYYSSSGNDNTAQEKLEAALNHALVQQRLMASGLRPSQIDAVMQPVSIDTLRIDEKGNTGKDFGFLAIAKITVEIFLLTLPILLYGMDMARSIIEEKSSRIFEVMLSVVRSSELLTGKLIGIGAVGLTQVAIWGVAAGVLTGSAVIAMMMAGHAMIRFSWAEGIFFPVYFVLGFLLYSSLFSGLAATCETVQEFQMFAPLAVLPTWFSFGIMPLMLNNPNSAWAVGASLFPFTSPFTMIPRIGLTPVPLWQIALSLALLIASIWGALWLSSRLYRIGILMYGKRATVAEIFRWLRYS